MKQPLLPIFLLWIVFIFPLQLNAQYNISAGGTVTECEGGLVDSQAGTEGDNFYDLNEDYTFTVCAPDAVSIEVSFSEFCTEEDLDVLYVYIGEDTTGELQAQFSGSAIPSPFIVLNEDCLTFNFVSSENVTCTGFELAWEAILDPVPPLSDITIPNVDCFSESFIATLEAPILCDAVTNDAFSLFGDVQGEIPITVDPVGCDADGFTTTIEITLSSGSLDIGAYYSLIFDYVYMDICGNQWGPEQGTATFGVVGCPLEVYINPEFPVACDGGCTELSAQAYGGDLNYSYSWSPSLPADEGPHTVCPGPTDYTVTVTDGSGETASTSVTIEITDGLGLDDPLEFCEQDPNFDMSTVANGGIWYWWQNNGDYVESYNFDIGYQTVGSRYFYYDFGGCTDSIEVIVHEAWANWNQSACVGDAPFQMFDGLEAGGVWSGLYVSPTGVFTPTLAGEFDLTYTTPLGCEDVKTMIVADQIEINLPVDPIMCQSQFPFTIDVSPQAGNWTEHPGFENTWNDIFYPEDAGPGVHTLYYTTNSGCMDSVTVTIIEADAGGDGNSNYVVCPSEGIVALPTPSPAGGVFSTTTSGSTGLQADLLTYDTGVLGPNNYNEILLYTAPSGCFDTLYIRGRVTNINNTFVQICKDEPDFALNWNNVGRSPGGGLWSGPGLTSGGANATFSPILAGIGVHTLYYTANTCVDSMVVEIYDVNAGSDTTVCELSSAFSLSGTPASGGDWWGYGVNEVTNQFDPQETGIGEFEVFYGYYFPDTDDYCENSIIITVAPVDPAVVDPIGPDFCYEDIDIPLSGSPAGGSFTLDGEPITSFNPIDVGPGAYILQYTSGEGECATFDQTVVTVGDTLGVVVNSNVAGDAAICVGEGAVIEASGFGGVGSNFSYQWSNGSTNASQFVEPAIPTTYTVTVTDICTEPIVGEIFVPVAPAISYNISTNDILCGGEEGFADIQLPAGVNYDILWETGGTEPLLNATVGDYFVTITDTDTNCDEEISVELPSYGNLFASFTPNPNVGENCLPILTVNFIENVISDTPLTGYWDFGDGTTTPYGFSVEHTYATSGDYVVTLYVENAGGCSVTHEVPICLSIPNDILMPTAFTPNGDGVNDVFKPEAFDVDEFSMKIYDRWGNLLFETDDPDKGWNGKVDFDHKEIGVYTYVATYFNERLTSPRMLTGTLTLLR